MKNECRSFEARIEKNADINYYILKLIKLLKRESYSSRFLLGTLLLFLKDKLFWLGIRDLSGIIFAFITLNKIL